jgi:hypothetical protein
MAFVTIGMSRNCYAKYSLIWSCDAEYGGGIALSGGFSPTDYGSNYSHCNSSVYGSAIGCLESDDGGLSFQAWYATVSVNYGLDCIGLASNAEVDFSYCAFVGNQISRSVLSLYRHRDLVSVAYSIFMDNSAIPFYRDPESTGSFDVYDCDFDSVMPEESSLFVATDANRWYTYTEIAEFAYDPPDCGGLPPAVCQFPTRKRTPDASDTPKDTPEWGKDVPDVPEGVSGNISHDIDTGSEGGERVAAYVIGSVALALIVVYVVWLKLCGAPTPVAVGDVKDS